MAEPVQFAQRGDKTAIEEGAGFAPKFDRDGLIACITCDQRTKDILMVAWMNEEALKLTIETGIAHYWSRSRQSLWRKGDTSGQTQQVMDMRTDCDQDAIMLNVIPGGDGGACHTGRTSCFYRRVVRNGADAALEFIEDGA